jgi:hypothetical protein
MKMMIVMKCFIESGSFAEKLLFVMQGARMTERQFCEPVMLPQLFEHRNVRCPVEVLASERHCMMAETIEETKMIQLGPHPMHLRNAQDEVNDFTVTVFLNDPTHFEFEDGDTVEEFHGHVIVALPDFERKIEATALNALELTGRLMMLAEAYIMRTCEVEKLTVFNTVQDDIKVPTDMFR